MIGVNKLRIISKDQRMIILYKSALYFRILTVTFQKKKHYVGSVYTHLKTHLVQSVLAFHTMVFCPVKMKLIENAVPKCGEGGVVQRSLQREKDSGDSGK